MTRLLNTPIIGRNAAPVASSCSDMLAGLSKKEILSVPPAFWAKAPSEKHSAISSPPTIATARSFPIIGCSSRNSARRDPPEGPGYHAASERGYRKIGYRPRRLPPMPSAERARRLCAVQRKVLVVEPQILEAVAVVDAVDHDRHALQPGLPAGRHARIEKGRPGVVLGQFILDLPDDPFALFDINLHRLAVDHLVDLGVAIAGIVSLGAADIVLVEDRIGIVDSGLGDVEADLV